MISVFLLAGCPPADGDDPTDAGAEICGNGMDDDGAKDCEDTDCAATCPELCGDGLDNDGDGATDCDDDDCDGTCPEVCTDGRDNDGDGRVDCDDADCADPSCVEICNDGRDNDGDGVSDCSDADCNEPACDEWCTDARDNDGDGLADCDDPDCDGLCPENCTDGRDNDGDGLADCDDPHCEIECPEDCLDFVDNNADGLVDCLDPECDVLCDADGDGYLNGDHGGDDCDDANFAVHPDAVEVCNGLDDDCNGLADEDDPDLDVSTLLRFYPDEDGDGFGNRLAGGIWACSSEDGLVADDKDCDDTNPDINPAMFEICNDLDDDCDGLTDDADPSVDLSTAPTFWLDADGDGWGDAASPLVSCHSPPGYVDNDLDCDDTDGGVGGALLDWYADLDGDGHGAGAIVESACIPSDPSLVYVDDDCDDTEATTYPGAPEPCDLVDNDCDGLLDWDDASNQCTIIGDGVGASVSEVEAVLGPDDIGYGTALDGDGIWLAAGIPDGADDAAGLVQLFDGSSGAWLLGPSFESGLAPLADGFGSAVALRGNRLVVGAPGAGTGGQMFAWDRDPATGVWNALPAWDPAGVAAADAVGTAVAIGGDRVYVGAPGDDAAGTDAGAVFALVWDGSDWVLDAVFEGDGAFAGLGAVLDADGDLAVSTQGDEVCFLDGPAASMDCSLGSAGVVDAAISGARAAAAALGAVDVWEQVGPTWTRTHILVPHELPVDGYATSVDLDGDLLVAGSPNADEPAAHVWKDITGTWVEAAWVQGSGGVPSDVLLIQGPSVYKASNCIPFGDGFNYDPYMGFIYRDIPAFDLRAGNEIAFDLWTTNDVDIEMDIALAHTTVNGGTVQDAVGFVPVASGKPAAPRGNTTFLDYELRWTVTNPYSFPGGGLIVRFNPKGAFAADASCTGVVSTCDRTDPSGNYVQRFYSDTDGVSPWSGWDTAVIGVAKFTISSTPTFGTEVMVDDRAVWVGAPADPLDPGPGAVAVCEPAGVAPAW